MSQAIDTRQVRVAVRASDPVSHAGLTSCLLTHPDIEVVGPSPAGTADADVVLFCVDRFSTAGLPAPRRRPTSGPPIVLVVSEISEEELAEAVRWGVVGVLPRRAVTAERAGRSVRAATGTTRSPGLGRELFKDFQELQKTARATGSGELTAREAEVLRMMADGFDTGEIARKLSYSERTVKSVVFGILRRLNLQNRSHAVAYALRTGMI